MIDMETFTDRFAQQVRAKRSNLIVGLDPQFKLLPPPLLAKVRAEYGPTEQAIGEAYFAFNKEIIDATIDNTAAYKPQRAFYREHSHWTERAFTRTVEYIHGQGEIAIEDTKVGDGSDTAEAYANECIGVRDFWGDEPGTFKKMPSEFRVDCLTVQPGIGDACILPFVKRVLQFGTGIFVVTKSSFKPNSRVELLKTENGYWVWEVIAMMVDKWGEGTEGRCGYRNVGVVMGATYPTDAPRMREILPKAWFLIPGFSLPSSLGQGGTADEAVVGINKDGLGGGANISRGIDFAYLQGAFARSPQQFASAAAAAALASRDALNDALKRAGKWNY